MSPILYEIKQVKNNLLHLNLASILCSPFTVKLRRAFCSTWLLPLYLIPFKLTQVWCYSHHSREIVFAELGNKHHIASSMVSFGYTCLLELHSVFIKWNFLILTWRFAYRCLSLIYWPESFLFYRSAFPNAKKAKSWECLGKSAN